MNIRLSLFRASSLALLVAATIIFGTGSFGQVLNNFGYGYGYGYGYGGTDEPSLAAIQKSILGKFYTSLNGDDWIHKDGWAGAASVCDWFGITCNSSGAITEINLVDNMLQGALIDDIWTLPSLIKLSLSKNQIVGTLPVRLSNESLQILDLAENKISGNLPSEILSFPKLSLLNLRKNSIEGNIPDSLSGLANLEYLYLDNNKLSGAIPDIFSNLTNLKVLSLSGNELSGSLPILSTASSLESIDLSSNSFTGELNDVFSPLRNLKLLHLFDNNWTGPSPAWLSSLSSVGVTVVTVDQGRYAFTNVLPRLELEVDTSLRIDSQRDGNESAVVLFISSDVDGVISSFYLYRNNELIYSGSTTSGTLTIPLVSGINSLRFNVVDDRGGITTVEKVIRVSAPPTIQITAPSSIVLDTDGLPGEFVSFSASVQDIDGDGYTVDWYINGIKRGSGINLTNILLGNGESEIEAMAIETGTDLADRSLLLPYVEPPVYQPSSTWPKAIVGEAKNILEFNNIAEIDVERGLMFACLVTVSGEAALPPIGVRFLLNLGAEITLTLDATRGFNPTGAFMENGFLPTCSGVFDKRSGIYTDYIYYDGNNYELHFESRRDSNSFTLKEFRIF